MSFKIVVTSCMDAPAPTPLILMAVNVQIMTVATATCPMLLLSAGMRAPKYAANAVAIAVTAKTMATQYPHAIKKPVKSPNSSCAYA